MRTKVYKAEGETRFNLPWLPLDRLKEVLGAKLVGGAKGCEVIQVPVVEGVAFIGGRIRIENDGAQTFVNGLASLVAHGGSMCSLRCPSGYAFAAGT